MEILQVRVGAIVTRTFDCMCQKVWQIEFVVVDVVKTLTDRRVEYVSDGIEVPIE